MASDKRQCPRCKTWNPWSSPNCSQCGAVMLGVGGRDVSHLLERPQAASPDPTSAPTPPKKGKGCLGCLTMLVLLAALGMFVAVAVQDHAGDPEIQEALQKAKNALKKLEGEPQAPPVVPTPVPIRPPEPEAPPPQQPDVPAEPPPPPEEARETGTDDARVQTLARTRRARLQGCYKLGMVALTTPLKANLAMDTGGRVTGVEVTQPPDLPSVTRKCVDKALRTLRFPPGTGPRVAVEVELADLP